MTGRASLREAIKSAIRDHADGDQGAPVDDVLSAVGGAYGESESAAAFDDMKKRGDVYVVPGDDADRVKITARSSGVVD